MPINPIPEPTKKERVQQAAARGERELANRAPIVAAFLAGLIVGYWIA